MSEDKPRNTVEEYDSFALSEQHNSAAGGFSELSKPSKDDPTIEHYVRLRRENPNVLIEVATSWSMEWLLSNSELLENFGIDPQLMAGALDADPQNISEVSLRLLECLVERRSLEKTGKTHIQSRGEGIGDSLVNYLIAMMLDALDWTDNLYIPRDLIVLAKHQLGAEISAEAKAQEVRERRSSATWIAAQMRHQGGKGSMRDVAAAMRVSPSTVARWFPDNSFETAVEQIKIVFDSGWYDDIGKTARKLKERKAKD